MTEHDKQSSGVEAAANVQPSQGRRRWVKGAMLATPAVMTLMSGRLASAASICTNNQGSTVDITDLNQNVTLNAQADLKFYDQYNVMKYTINSGIYKGNYFFYNGYRYANGDIVNESALVDKLSQRTGKSGTAYQLRVLDNQALTNSCMVSMT